MPFAVFPKWEESEATWFRRMGRGTKEASSCIDPSMEYMGFDMYSLTF